MVSILLLFFGVVIASGICSMSEAAILSIPFVRARILHEEKRKNSADLMYVKENLPMAISTIVVLNNAVNIIGSIYLGHQVSSHFGNQWLGFASTVLTLFIIVVSEIIPKTLGERYKVPLSLFFAKPLRWLSWIFAPFLKGIMRITGSLSQTRLPRVTEEEIRMMLKLGRDAGTVEMDEEVLCNRVFKLNDLRAVQIMKPLDQIYALPADKTLRELKGQIINSLFSRIAVYDKKDPLNIVGIVQHRILLREIAKDNYDAKVKDFMFEPIFVHQLTKADTLLEKFQQYAQHLFIVQDNTGNDVGLVTMEDVLEELFGEIYDETDIVPKLAKDEK